LRKPLPFGLKSIIFFFGIAKYLVIPEKGKKRRKEGITMSMPEKKVFKVARYGLATGKNGPVAAMFHGEATVVRAEYRETANGKSVLTLGAAIGCDPRRLLNEVPHSALTCSEDAPWVDIVLFGKAAEEGKDQFQKGDKVAFCGSVRQSSWSKQDGSEAAKVEILANRVVKLSSRIAPDGEPLKPGWAKATRLWTRQDGSEGQTALAQLVMGRVKSVDGLRTVNGKDVLGFVLEMPQPAAELWRGMSGGEHKLAADDCLLDCSVWGKGASKLSHQIVKPGAHLVVSGSLSINEWNGEQSLRMLVDANSVAKWATAWGEKQANPAPASAGGGNTAEEAPPADLSSLMMDDDDDELPF
jgi:single-stranded DNA-binding protein